MRGLGFRVQGLGFVGFRAYRVKGFGSGFMGYKGYRV